MDYSVPTTIKKIILVSAIASSDWCSAHDTNTSHPRITEVIIKSIESQDFEVNAYHQLYQHHPKYRTAQYGEARYTVPLDSSYPYLWGYDPKFRDKIQKAIDEDDDAPNYKAFRKLSLDVIDGVVMEDTPDSRVMSHFQHAYTGSPLSIDDWLDSITYYVDWIYGTVEPSEITAGRFFNKAITTMGYINSITDLREAQPDKSWTLEQHGRELSGAKAMWLFGHALHHAEDMMSIAHVHNDAHLTRLKDQLGEPDDYEAHFIPSKIYEFINRQDIDKWFVEVAKHKLITSADQIWSRKTSPQGYSQLNTLTDPNNMSRGIYNTALFQADLSYDVEMRDTRLFTHPISVLIENNIKAWNIDVEATKAAYRAANKLCGKGELSKMFYFGALSDFDSDLGPKIDACGLKLNIWSRSSLPQYEIMHAAADSFGDRGDFNVHEFKLAGKLNSLFAEWWEASAFGGPQGYYYIEQTMKGVTYEGEVAGRQISPGEVLLRPVYIRQDITKPFSASNPLIKTCDLWSKQELRCFRGDSLLERYAEKLIPYSMEFLVGYSQFFYDIANLPPYLQQVEVIQQERKSYGMRWLGEVKSDGRIEMTDERGQGSHSTEYFSYISGRYKVQTIPHLSFMTQEQDLTVQLKFNEVIRHPQLKDSAFSLGLSFNGNEAVFDNNELSFSILPSDTYKGCQILGEEGSETSNCWRVRVPANALKSLFSDDLNGRVTLLVKAADINNHRDAKGFPSNDLNHGALLDATPQTPARRYVTRSGPEFTIFDDGKSKFTSRENRYFWHSDTTSPGDMFGLSSEEKGAFAYHPGYDKNHVLLFDSSAPEIRLNVSQGSATPEKKEL
ncbi:hypothetical protein J8M20_06690 [Pseudoalteromonas luteoviolacea]|uniref:hypothetical protein n=1 Tax=Pseudoalteromonas luteoviolacea TaxID=43657 RepID=UPI001B3815D8|nr:hypothetical protein [Pseudoalteromonas luteoviolacea]MBQ4811015.1 hypothetical protein [Pseudoalteromonas luteoviolacea]